MWTKELFGTDIYHLIAAFVVYSILGWFVESIYMSFCNRKLTNRGFAKGPFCPIYGFGAVLGYLFLSPLRGRYILLYFTGAILATGFEFLSAKLMLRVLGKLWWDYTDKPFNYKGILCLESTIAWGFYALGIVGFLHGKVYQLIDLVSVHTGIRIVTIILCLVIVDYVIQICRALGVDFSKQKDYIIEKYQHFKARWY